MIKTFWIAMLQWGCTLYAENRAFCQCCDDCRHHKHQPLSSGLSCGLCLSHNWICKSFYAFRFAANRKPLHALWIISDLIDSCGLIYERYLSIGWEQSNSGQLAKLADICSFWETVFAWWWVQVDLHLSIWCHTSSRLLQDGFALPYSVWDNSTAQGMNLLADSHSQLMAYHKSKGINFPAEVYNMLPTEAVVAFWDPSITWSGGAWHSNVSLSRFRCS